MIPSLIAVSALALLTLLGGVWVLSRARWFTGFFYGVLGWLLLASAAAAVTAALELSRYSALPQDDILGTVTVSANANDNTYQITFNRVRGTERYAIRGDNWTLAYTRVRVPSWLLFGQDRTWHKLLGATGQYRLTQDQKASEQTLPEPSWLEYWGQHSLALLFSPQHMETRAVRLAADAIYTVRYDANSLRLEPVNEEARQALTPP